VENQEVSILVLLTAILGSRPHEPMHKLEVLKPRDHLDSTWKKRTATPFQRLPKTC